MKIRREGIYLGLWFIALTFGVALFQGGCSFDTGLSGLECDQAGEVRPGEVCRDGYWRIVEDIYEGGDDSQSPQDISSPRDTTPEGKDVSDVYDVQDVSDAADVSDTTDITDADADTSSDADTSPDADATGCAEGTHDLDGDGICEYACEVSNGGVEVCDGLDNNCDGQIDEGDPGGGATCETANLGICKPGITACILGALECNAINPSVPEDCGSDGTGNGLDDDCDGEVDEGCAECVEGDARDCYTGPAGTQGRGECLGGTQVCTGGQWPACAGEVTPATEICNGKDDDCDGVIDNGVTTTYYLDGDNDGYGDDDPTTSIQACSPSTGYVENADDCDDANAAINPDAVEVCDGFDNNCDGNIDQTPIGVALTKSCGSNIGECEEGIKTCDAGSWGPCVGGVSSQPEVCDGLDNSCSGVADDGLATVNSWVDADGDSYGVGRWRDRIQKCDGAPGYATRRGDCDDDNPITYPGAPEICDGENNNCNAVGGSGDDDYQNDHRSASAWCRTHYEDSSLNCEEIDSVYCCSTDGDNCAH